ncbi:amidase domain-containing protein [Paenibacillus mendelii]|uniref:Amidase domain-containing protein n=1 Tax=Paenibacillus mendelii TaxID=206163 RepID=A0ABV6JCS0_9BACL|nr:amidase domain-containing protein [Paenibacillus mendelii]MCQ6562550.1 amidase domain-containing protein [Paenibacillus mendelii]
MPRTGNKQKKPGSRNAVTANRSIAAASRSAGREAEAVPEGWKATVHEYVKLYNQAEIDRYSPALSEVVKDRDHLSRLGHRLERMREAELMRGVIPSKSETSAGLLHISESSSGSEVSVMLELHIIRTMEQHGRSYMEERCERERLWLAAENRSYRIARIEPLVLERRPRYGMQQQLGMLYTSDDHSEENYNTASIPFINVDMIPNFKQQRQGVRYRRDLAAAYADRWWNEANPAYENFDVNCTNYVSQCLFAGQAPMNYTGKRAAGWWYRGRSGGREQWSYSWAVSNALQLHLSAARRDGLRATVVDSPEQLALGDVIVYDWGGDGRYQHSTVVTAFDSSGMPLVNANTVASRHRYWDYRDSYAWTEQTRYRFFHIADEL